VNAKMCQSFLLSTFSSLLSCSSDSSSSQYHICFSHLLELWLGEERAGKSVFIRRHCFSLTSKFMSSSSDSLPSSIFSDAIRT
jgi:hypothetical protein